MGLSKVASGIAFGKRNLQDVIGDGLSKRKLLEEVLCRSVHVRSVQEPFINGHTNEFEQAFGEVPSTRSLNVSFDRSHF